MPTRNLVWLLVAATVSFVCFREAGRNRYASSLSESIDKIARHYVEPVDSRQLFEGGLRGMLGELDPYSGYISPDEIDQFNVEIEQQFGGIGIEVGVENGRLTVFNPVPGSPAYEAGLMAGDMITAIDGQDTEGFALNDAVRLMRGPKGTRVDVQVLHRGADEPVNYEIERAEIQIESVRGDLRNERGDWSFVLEEHPRIAYIRLLSFGDKTSADLKQALSAIDGHVDGLIMDLRGNAGGLLNSAVEACDMFIPAGLTIVTTRGRNASQNETISSTQPPLVDPELPVVVLVDRFSASASEIFAACLQDHHRATIVGERTWGKGTVQNVIVIEGGRSAIRLTTQTYWRPSGKNIHRHRDDDDEDAWGVRPAEENTIEFAADEFRQNYEARRKRDYVNSRRSTDPPLNDTATSNDDIDAAATDAPQSSPDDAERSNADSSAGNEGLSSAESTEREPGTDRQLQRAVEVLLSAIAQRSTT